MYISLDCYQILGLPIQATPDQLEQAHHDRQQQQPHHHFSTTTLSTREEIITQAYQTLRNPISRSHYDQAVISYAQSLKSQPQPEEPPPGIQIEDSQFAGALLLLYELGAYSQVVELGEPHVGGGRFDLRRPYMGSALAESDILLTVALSYLELGREQWQQGHYEPAAYYLQGGLNILVSENQFTDVQTQLKTELYRLRPYRVLELVAHPDIESNERQRGLMLLKDMLLEREGIDGNRNDHSGLGIDDFLKFIQQLRAYLSTAEQQELFEAEARRPSAVGTYLASYALIARGVSQHQPALIRRAKSMLKRLLPHQDVYLEIASAALLLGQTHEALQTLSLTQDVDALSFIKDYSLSSPDLLPGLYHYTDQWLTEEVYPAFRDLVGQPVGLEAYFADDQIQAYADALAAETATRPQPATVTTALSPPSTDPIFSVPPLPAPSPAVDPLTPPTVTSPPLKPDYAWPSLPTFSTDSETTLSPSPLSTPTSSFPSLSAPTLPYEPIANLPSSLTSPRPTHHLNQPDFASPSDGPPLGPEDRPSPNHKAVQILPQPAQASPRRLRHGLRIAQPGRFASVCLLLGLGVVGIGFAVRGLWLDRSSPPILTRETPPTPLSPPASMSPSPNPVALDSPMSEVTTSPTAPTTRPAPINASIPSPSNEILTTEMAQARIADWQKAKASALGQEYKISYLEEILAEPALSRWKSTAQTSQFEQSHWQFELGSIEIDSLRPLGVDRFEVMARIREAAKLYQGDQLQTKESYEDDYQVRYVFIRQGNTWLIREMKVVS
ncbi:IMS domain-containing protein [Synechococcus sp. PCC 6312]|uniref:IMS domain-containing protein n=1 Tax=Synechococcus sp. (strain ATCC 27167 / PCC 6312) TaxID=195253 RepID=UPI00029F33AC|nr:IMS domain-containing protein [Synechococcus sp. PCC 6312]AFY62249.1 DnaJ-class molecular chaperone with C-terminal Zn finger domain [Synechococcus sp. PCC 6312]